MKGIVFSINKAVFAGKKHRRLDLRNIVRFIKNNGILLAFIILLFTGLIIGSVYAQNANSSLLKSLDFLFTTNFDVRLAQNAIGTFCACFASDFIFLCVIFLLGFAPWGMALIPVVVLFKGFGTGLTAGYLFMLYSLKGIGFYLLILLPGAFLFCMALVMFSASAFCFSKKFFTYTISRNVPEKSLWKDLVGFSSQAMSSLIMIFCSAVLDAVLWTLFAGIFNF